MTRRHALPILLALTLLVTQTAGYAHALSHFNTDLVAKDRVAHASLCAKCASFDKLMSIVPTLACIELHAAASTTPHIVRRARETARDTPPFQPRAPPLFV
jgi:hypothetical protein